MCDIRVRDLWRPSICWNFCSMQFNSNGGLIRINCYSKNSYFKRAIWYFRHWMMPFSVYKRWQWLRMWVCVTAGGVCNWLKTEIPVPVARHKNSIIFHEIRVHKLILVDLLKVQEDGHVQYRCTVSGFHVHAGAPMAQLIVDASQNHFIAV